MKECYVKCVSNEQAQKLRPYLVGVGFVDDTDWNDGIGRMSDPYDLDCINIDMDLDINIYDENIASLSTPLIHTVPDNANLSEAAKTIKELYDKQPQQ